MLRLSYVNTMRGLEDGLRVADIAVFDLLTCEPDERIRDVRERVGRLDFDNVPVRENGSIVGVVEGIKDFKPDATVGSVRAPLSEFMLIAGSASLRSFLPRINDRSYKLVVDDTGIQGVVTPSDVVQLPVRLLVFALLAHLEELMRASIRQKQPEDDLAVQGLETERLRRVRKTLKRQKAKGLNPSPLDVTAFIDKADPSCSRSEFLRTTERTAGSLRSFTTFETESTTSTGTPRRPRRWKVSSNTSASSKHGLTGSRTTCRPTTRPLGGIPASAALVDIEDARVDLPLVFDLVRCRQRASRFEPQHQLADEIQLAGPRRGGDPPKPGMLTSPLSSDLNLRRFFRSRSLIVRNDHHEQIASGRIWTTGAATAGYSAATSSPMITSAAAGASCSTVDVGSVSSVS